MQSIGEPGSPASRIRNPRNLMTLAVVVVAVVVAAWLTSIVRGYTFLADEWVFITERRDISIDSLLMPYNNHWQTVPILAYQVALELRGLGAYTLIAAFGAVSHALAALALYAVLRDVRPWLAGAATVALLAFAWSDEVVLWPVSAIFSLPVAFGFGAIALWSRERPQPLTDAAGTLALIVAFASGGVAIAIAVVATTILLVRTADRRRLAWPAAAWLTYVAWYLAFGRSGDALGNALSSDLTLLPAFVGRGLAALAAPALGQNFRFQEVSLLVIALGIGLAAGRLGMRPMRGWIALAGVAFLYGLVGLARLKDFDVAGAEAPRYTYAAFALLLLGAATIVDRLHDSIASSRGRRLLAAGVAAWLVVALVGDAGKLARSTVSFGERATTIRTELWLLETLRPAIDGRPAAGEHIDTRFFGNMSPGAYYRVIDDIADLPGPVDSPRVWPAAQRLIAEELLGRLFAAELALRPLPAAPPNAIDSSDRRYELHDMTTGTTDAGCTMFTVIGADPYVALRLRDGESIAIRTDGQRSLQAFPRMLTDEFGAIVKSTLPVPGAWYAFAPPALGEAWPWRVRVDAPPGSSTLDVCLVPGPAA